MANAEPNTEIEQLRKQLDALKKEREATEQSNEPEPDENPVEEQKEAAVFDEIAGAVDEIGDDLATHFKEFLDNLDEDLKSTRPSTLLIVFALGVLIGRLR